MMMRRSGKVLRTCLCASAVALGGCGQFAPFGLGASSLDPTAFPPDTTVRTSTGYLIAGENGGDDRKIVLARAGAGTIVGTGIGLYMDQQEAALRRRLDTSGVSVTRVGDDIVLNMPGSLTFAAGSAEIDARFFEVLNSVARSLSEFDLTLVDVYGHSDSSGTVLANLKLSESRAESVALFLIEEGVDPKRVLVRGMGESQPIAPNTTPEDRAQNRRVEIRVAPLAG